MSGPNSNSKNKACHNCRRRRLRCDRSHPFCHKCSRNGEECLGYGTIIRWANAPAVRGKMALANATSQNNTSSLVMTKAKPLATTLSGTIQPCLMDPLLNPLDSKSRNYMHHFTTEVCRDLVSVDQKDRNPFRAMIPLAGKVDYLQAIVVATGAIHLAMLHNYHNGGGAGNPKLVDALVAKDKAIRCLKNAISAATPASQQATILAAVVFFINFDLIDSGKGGWLTHIEAATALMASLRKQQLLQGLDSSLVRLVDVTAADCLTYRILGTTISTVDISWTDDASETEGLFDVLRRAEAHSYHCCPAAVLQIIMATSRLSQAAEKGLDKTSEALGLLERALSFPVEEWVHSIRGLSLEDDLTVRVSLASAHRATACLYLLLTVPDVEGLGTLSVDGLVQEVRGYLSSVPNDHVLLKGTAWPMFMAGGQTDDVEQRQWYLERLGVVWANNPFICPWGYIRTAGEMLRELWAAMDEVSRDGKRWNCVQEMKARSVQCLIV
ncbi:acriflavine sensitivity control protein acr-2 [Cladorrhinum sp. PSN259]|nr:acriflavine sensitivity control protein acr-2 [Cladorrhinum sp. PSN259]